MGCIRCRDEEGPGLGCRLKTMGDEKVSSRSHNSEKGKSLPQTLQIVNRRRHSSDGSLTLQQTY